VRVGWVARVAAGPDSALEATLRLWPGAPKAFAVVPLTAGEAGDTPLPALLQGEPAEGRAYLVLPPRTFSPSRVLRSIGTVPERRYRLTRVERRGLDYECTEFETVI